MFYIPSICLVSQYLGEEDEEKEKEGDIDDDRDNDDVIASFYVDDDENDDDDGNAALTTRRTVCLFVGCLTSQQQASVSQGRICSDNFTCCHI